MSEEAEFQTTIDMLMDKKEQTRIGINPNDVEHKRDINLVLCRILEEYEAQAKRIAELEELKRTVQISCNPPKDCNDPVVLKTYMKACYDTAMSID